MVNSRYIMLAALGLMIVLSLGVGYIIWPNYRQAAVIRRQTADLRAKVDDLSGQTQAVHRLAEDVTRARQRVETTLKPIPETQDMAGLIQKLSQDVDHMRVRDQTFTVGSVGDAIIGGKSSMQAMPLTVDIEATFDSVFALIQNAESIDRLVRIASVRVLCKRDDKQPSNPPIVKASVGLEAIFDPPVPQEVH